MNALWNIIPLLWSSALALVSLPVIIHALGVGPYGVYGMFAVILAPIGLANLGFSEATIRFGSKAIGGQDLASAARYVQTSLMMALVVGVAGAVMLWWGGYPILTRLFRLDVISPMDLERCTRIVAITWFANQVAAVLGVVPVMFQQYRTVAVVQTVNYTVGTVLGIVLVKTGQGLVGYVASFAISAVLGLLVWIVVSRRLFRGYSLRPHWFQEEWGNAFRFGRWQVLSQVGGIASNQGERFVLARYLTPSAVGLMNIALSLEQKIYLAAFKMSEVLFPFFSGSSAGVADLDRLIRASWLLTTCGTALLAPIVALAHPVLQIWIGPDVASSASLTLKLLAIAGCVGSATNASYFYLLAGGHSGKLAAMTGVTGAVTMLVALLLLPRYGFAAAAIPGIIAMLAQQLCLVIVLRRVHAADGFPLGRVLSSMYVPLLAALTLAIATAQVGWLTGLSSWVGLAASYGLMVLVIVGLAVLSTFFLPFGGSHRCDMGRIWAKFAAVRS